MKKKLLILISLFATAAILIWMLHYYSFLAYYKRDNNFSRSFVNRVRGVSQNIVLPDECINLVKMPSTGFTVVKKDLTVIYGISNEGKIVDTVPVSVFRKENLKRFHNIFIVDTVLTVIDPVSRTVASYSVNKNYRKIHSLTISTCFDRGVLTGDKIILRSVDSSLSYGVFKSVDLTTGKVSNEPAEISIIENDGGLTTDGFFVKLNDTSALYIFYYQDSYKCIDENLHLSFTRKLNFTAKDTPIVVKTGEGAYSFASPAVAKSARAFVNNNTLYVNSFLISDNEKPADFKYQSVIDMYDLKTGEYTKSFYIPPDDTGDKMKDFYIKDNKLVALYPFKIIVYDFLNDGH